MLEKSHIAMKKMDTSIKKAQQLLDEGGKRTLTGQELQEKTLQLAAAMLQEARRLETSEERKRRSFLANMLKDPQGMQLVVRLADQSFRSRVPARAMNQIAWLLHTLGLPSFLPWGQRLMLRFFPFFGRLFPGCAVALMKKMIRKEASPMIQSEERLHAHLRQRKQQGIAVNLNHVGEAILGEEEAQRRVEMYVHSLAQPDVECLSIKISSLYSQINLVAWEETLQVLENRLKTIYRAAKNQPLTLADGRRVPKLVTLDMEEYRDLALTVELFKHTLEDPEFFDFPAGIVLQSYLPDAYLIQQMLTTWAMQRIAGGGAPIRLRLVKGANLAMEQVEASLRCWRQAPYRSKEETDANFVRMLDYGADPERSKAVHLAIGSHNLFDIAYGLLLRAQRNLQHTLSFEMLEGMAGSLSRVVQKLAGGLLLYCPAAAEQHFQNALAYLVRRLDENAGPDNFLHAYFHLTVDSQEWERQSALFIHALQAAHTPSLAPRRQQNRLETPLELDEAAPFENEPDTDWCLACNRCWADKILQEWKAKKIATLPLFPGSSGLKLEAGRDPSCPDSTLFRYPLPGTKELETALATAQEGFDSWSATPLEERLPFLHAAAQEMRRARGALIGAMVANTGKTVAEADAEISEAIDFLSYYRHQCFTLQVLKDLSFTPKGVTAVLSPWNFPCSIPVSGIAAALAAGNSVLFKPAPEAVLVGWILVNLFWKAGIGKQALQFFPCQDEPIGSGLVSDPRIASVVLTGSTATAKQLLKLRPGLDLMAETGGKNALIVTGMADRELAVRSLVHSAFGYAGQKCSACSLAILEKEVYFDDNFRKQLRDAAASLKRGSAWDKDTYINPLIRPPSPELLRGLTQLDPGEEWLLQPEQEAHNPQLWSPGIKLGIKKDSFFHQTELFGPVLGLMCAENIDEALELANSTPYGLTAGIHTLDEREQHNWSERIRAGNCYINRTITGAIVRRQPFGGCKESSFGRGAKAGGPNYPLQLMHVSQRGLPEQRAPVMNKDEIDAALMQKEWNAAQKELWQASLESYAFQWEHHFSKKHDPSQVLGQQNYFTYAPQPDLSMRIQDADQPIDFLRALAAALICRGALSISLTQKQYSLFTSSVFTEGVRFVIETEEELLQRIERGEVKKIRWLSQPSAQIQQALAKNGCNSFVAPLLANGRLELLNYLREVSLSIDSHRYGFGTHTPPSNILS
jgi:RHH-type proline utilization regulon transcriptional repressor/proline dehydrogenase/delta 1-pyrroline-5-carboxylate dehydrogenase